MLGFAPTSVHASPLNSLTHVHNTMAVATDTGTLYQRVQNEVMLHAPPCNSLTHVHNTMAVATDAETLSRKAKLRSRSMCQHPLTHIHD